MKNILKTSKQVSSQPDTKIIGAGFTYKRNIAYKN